MSGFDIKTAIITAVAIPVFYLILRRVSRFVQANTGQILDALFWMADRFIAESIATKMSLKRYCRAELARDATKFLQVPGASEAALLTDSTFVPLRLETSSRRVTTKHGNVWEDGATRVQIVGDPGSGKTSLVKKAFRDACRHALHEKRAPLPLVLELKNFVPPKRLTSDRALGDWAIRMLRERVEAVGGYQMGKLFDLSLSNRGLLVMLDGLDEVSSDTYPIIARAINSLSERLSNASPHNRVMLTMRTQFYRQIRSRFSDTFPRVYHIQPFTPGDIYNFLSLWPYPDAAAKKATVNRIFSELTDRPTLREMCSNPLVLAMYVASDQGGNSVGTPDTRTGFYSRVVDELLLFRRNRQLDAPVKSTLREQRERLFGILSFENLTDPAQPANLISWDRAIEVTTEIYGCKSRDVAAATLREVCKETGLMSEERSSETLRFIHLTFCEFLAAKEAIHGREAGWSELVSIHRSFSSDAAQSATKLVEVIPFAAGLMSRVMRAKMLDDVAILRDPRVFGRVFLETQAYDHPAWAFYAASEADYLTSTIRSHWNDDWLQRLHLFTVILADESEWRQAYNREPAAVTLEQLLKMLIQGDRERLVAVLGSYASVDPQAAFRLARSLEVDLVEDHPAIVIENLSNRPFRSLIVEDLASRKTPSLQQAMVLCEAAMANPYVAFALHEEPPTVLKFGTPSSIPRRFRWFVSGEPAAMSFGSNLFLLAYGLNLNLLTYSASIVANAHSVDVINTTTFPSCAQLAQLRAPGDFWFSKFLWLNKWLLLLPVSLLSIASAASVNAMLDSTWIGISVVVVFGVLAYWFSHNVAYYPKFRASYFAQFLQGVLQEFAGTRQFSRSDDGLVVFRPASLLARRASQPLIEAALSVRASPGSRKR